MLNNPPRLIALCGHPTSGKTTAAEIINEVYGHHLIDDGMPLRKMAMDYLGLTLEQVTTQAGKLEEVVINGRQWTVREVLGEIGNAFEDKFGADVIPMMSHNAMPLGLYGVFGSVRREQGFFHRSKGALVLEIVNPAVGPSPYEFDRYNAACCHAQVLNDGLARGLTPQQARLDLKAKLITAVTNHQVAKAA